VTAGARLLDNDHAAEPRCVVVERLLRTTAPMTQQVVVQLSLLLHQRQLRLLVAPVIRLQSLSHEQVHVTSAPLHLAVMCKGWLGSRVDSVLDSGAEGPGFKSQSPRCRVAVLGKLFTPIVPLFTKQQNW